MTSEKRTKQLISQDLREIQQRKARLIISQIREAVFKYEASTGYPPEKITMHQKVYEALKDECARLNHPAFIMFNHEQDRLFGIPVEVIADSPDGYVCAGGTMERVVFGGLNDV